MWQKGDKLVPSYKLPCGGTAHFDYESGISHRCDQCFAVVGSMGMPSECASMLRDEREKEQIRKALNNDAQRKTRY